MSDKKTIFAQQIIVEFTNFMCNIYHTMANTTTSSPGLPEALGQSEAFLQFQEQLSQVARVNRPVLLIGERGTGKELAAARLHYLSTRWSNPLVALDCATLPPTLIESELFGHEAGAFTGATRQRTGKFESADGGSLFLDEIGNIPLEAQEKILRVVEYGVFERVGGSDPVQADVRIIGATNADLVRMCEEGRFKRDLLDRLSFEVLFLPPLRRRKEDILLLAHHFATRMAFELGREEAPEFSPEAEQALEQYPWPGNIRELKNVVERAVYRSGSPAIETIHFDPFQSPDGFVDQNKVERKEETLSTEEEEVSFEKEEESLDFLKITRQVQIRLLRKALQKTRHHQKEAAALLGLTYHQFRGLYRKYHEEIK
jgi:psp operon transcriptional activator